MHDPFHALPVVLVDLGNAFGFFKKNFINFYGKLLYPVTEQPKKKCYFHAPRLVVEAFQRRKEWKRNQ